MFLPGIGVNSQPAKTYLTWGITPCLVQWGPRDLSLWVNQRRHEGDHSPAFSDEVQKVKSFLTFIPSIHLHSVILSTWIIWPVIILEHYAWVLTPHNSHNIQGTCILLTDTDDWAISVIANGKNSIIVLFIILKYAITTNIWNNIIQIITLNYMWLLVKNTLNSH